MMTADDLFDQQPERDLPETVLRQPCLSLYAIGLVIPHTGTDRSRTSTL
jgi:hypothetical protein